MGAIDHAEDDLFETAGWLVIFLLILLCILAYLAVNDIQLSENLYPFPLFSRFASGIDWLFDQYPEWIKDLFKGEKDATDSMLGRIGNWINNNLPRTPSENAAVAEPNPLRDAALADNAPFDPFAPQSSTDDDDLLGV